MFPATRAAARAQMEAFLPFLAHYAAKRNAVGPGHRAVSRLSPALRHRLLLEEEVVATVLNRFRFPTVEKFLQEIHWRTYWKGWLELRPQVWRHYRERVKWLHANLDKPELRRAEAVGNGQSGTAIMDRFARELTATGYLHNHARMWWAGFWVHVEKLPWELGADFFLRHLLDADPASNTLSWRWVAGLQTPGKTYLPRRSNLEKYCAPEWLQDESGLHRLADEIVLPFRASETTSLEIQPLPELLSAPVPRLGRVGLWLHEDDCAPEMGPLQAVPFAAIAAFRPAVPSQSPDMSSLRRTHLASVLQDGCNRAARHFSCAVTLEDSASLAASLTAWAVAEKLESIVAYSPFVGPLGDQLDSIRTALAERGIQLCLLRRPWDAQWFPLAKSGFFPYWAKVAARLRMHSAPQSQPELL